MNIPEIEAPSRENLIRLAQAYSKAMGINIATVSRQAHGDSPFIDGLIARHKRWIKDGKPPRADSDSKGSFTTRVYDRMVRWFIAHWPDGVELPPLNDLSPKHEDQNGTPEGKHQQAQDPENRQGETRGSTGSTSDRLRRLRERVV